MSLHEHSDSIIYPNVSRVRYKYNEDVDLYVREFGTDVSTVKLYNLQDYSHLNIRPGDTVIDGGAYIGRFARYAFQQGAKRVISVEPNSGNYLLMRESSANLATFRAPEQEHIIIHGALWGIRDNTSDRCYLTDHSKDKSLCTTYTMARGRKTWVDKVSFRELLFKYEPDVVKLDIEGEEVQLITSIPDYLAIAKLRNMWIEYHIRTVYDRRLAIITHGNVEQIMGDTTLEPFFDVNIKRKHFLHRTQAVYVQDHNLRISRNTYDAMQYKYRRMLGEPYQRYKRPLLTSEGDIF